MNVIALTGRLTKEPELKVSQTGNNYIFFCLAVDNGKDKNGQRQTDFIDCYASGQPANFMSSYAHKGDLLEAVGRLHITLREDDNGNKYKRHTVMVNSIGIASKKEITPAENRQPETKADDTRQTAPAEDFTNPSDLPFSI